MIDDCRHDLSGRGSRSEEVEELKGSMVGVLSAMKGEMVVFDSSTISLGKGLGLCVVFF